MANSERRTLKIPQYRSLLLGHDLKSAVGRRPIKTKARSLRELNGQHHLSVAASAVVFYELLEVRHGLQLS